MSVYVVDTTVVVARFLKEEYTPNAIALLNRLHLTDELAIPEFCIVECANVLWKQVLFKGMPQEQAEEIVEVLAELPLTLYLIDGMYKNALRLAIKHRLTIYDTLYIALAQELECPLITLDQKQMLAAAQEHVTVTPLTNFVP